MSMRIRLTRLGKKKQPFYRIVVTDRENARDSRYLDLIGTYDPRCEDENKRVVINKEKANEWLAKGATPSETVSKILKSN